MSLWMAAKGEYIYLPQHLESRTVKFEFRNQLVYKRRQSSAFSFCQTSVFASDVWRLCINSSFVGKLCSRIGPLIWTICCAVACTLQVGVPEYISAQRCDVGYWDVGPHELPVKGQSACEQTEQLSNSGSCSQHDTPASAEAKSQGRPLLWPPSCYNWNLAIDINLHLKILTCRGSFPCEIIS
ncbi:Hypothetical predicted protein [Scomber scombrus]|uniref:Uncharacterized protein n=1 Tax=Scomber scombrus TaxID=13677 RepID=A0AAV1NT32_SCOSC